MFCNAYPFFTFLSSRFNRSNWFWSSLLSCHGWLCELSTLTRQCHIHKSNSLWNKYTRSVWLAQYLHCTSKSITSLLLHLFRDLDCLNRNPILALVARIITVTIDGNTHLAVELIALEFSRRNAVVVQEVELRLFGLCYPISRRVQDRQKAFISELTTLDPCKDTICLGAPIYQRCSGPISGAMATSLEYYQTHQDCRPPVNA